MERTRVKSTTSLGRTVVETYPRYAEAQLAVDRLADASFPVERVEIVAHGLRLVEHVTGTVRLWTATVEAAWSGAVVGVLLGFVLGVLSVVDPLVSAFALAAWGAVAGAFIGLIVGALSYAFRRRDRDFSSTTHLDADRYDLVVDEEVAHEATRLLRRAATPPPRR